MYTYFFFNYNVLLSLDDSIFIDKYFIRNASYIVNIVQQNYIYFCKYLYHNDINFLL